MKKSKLPLSRKQFRAFVNDRMKHFNTKVLRISTWDKDCIIFTAKCTGTMSFHVSFAYIMDVNYDKKEITYAIRNDIYGFNSIINEVEFFRRNPKDAEKRGVTVV